jgi:hypothetical protein
VRLLGTTPNLMGDGPPSRSVTSGFRRSGHPVRFLVRDLANVGIQVVRIPLRCPRETASLVTGDSSMKRKSKVSGRGGRLYRAIDQFGQVIDVLVSTNEI